MQAGMFSASTGHLDEQPLQTRLRLIGPGGSGGVTQARVYTITSRPLRLEQESSKDITAVYGDGLQKKTGEK